MPSTMTRRIGRLLAACLLAFHLAACAAPAPAPGASGDLLAAAVGADPARSVALMRQQGERFARAPFLGGNEVRLLVDGPASFAALAEAIRNAHARVDMETYEFDEQAGGEFADILLAARARGVEVNLIYDAFGALGTPAALFERLRRGGVRVLEYNPLAPNARVPVDLNRRDHRKLLVADGRVVITGGVNITRVYHNLPGRSTTDPDEMAWRDTDVRIEGPVAAQFGRHFVDTWRRQKGPPIADPPPASPPADGPTLVQAIDGAPEDGRPLIYRTLLAVIALSQHSIHLTTGFFVPTPDLARALRDAARRGVDVQIVIPGISDSTEAVEAGRSRYDEMLEAGVKLHEFQGRVLHSKTAVIDGGWCSGCVKPRRG